jgi:hypothetical protein
MTSIESVKKGSTDAQRSNDKVRTAIDSKARELRTASEASQATWLRQWGNYLEDQVGVNGSGGEADFVKVCLYCMEVIFCSHIFMMYLRFGRKRKKKPWQKNLLNFCSRLAGQLRLVRGTLFLLRM